MYQASILVDLDEDKILRYLKHPSKEPDYRQGRSHKDFLISLAKLLRGFSAEDCLQLLSVNLMPLLESELSTELSSPNNDHIPHLLKRANMEE